MRRAALAPGPWGDGGMCRRDAADDEMAELNMDPHRFPDFLRNSSHFTLRSHHQSNPLKNQNGIIVNFDLV